MLCQYSFRRFYSKGATLVLVWVLLTAAGNRVLYKILDDYNRVESYYLTPFTYIISIAVTPFIGWLADAKLGNYKVVKIGITASWLASVMLSVFGVVKFNTTLGSDQNELVSAVLIAIISVIQWAGTFIMFINTFQLSLEQIPDASAENITSLVAWFAFSVSCGLYLGEIVLHLLLSCAGYDSQDLYQALTLFPVMCASINSVMYYLLSPKWLIIEPKSPQSLKNIYRVLRFAAKHKAPLNRSALTYWEEDIPSRLDLGKSRYGGPFTTEQVEDVKTFFRLLAVGMCIFLIMLSWSVPTTRKLIFVEPYNLTKFNVSTCEANGIFLITTDTGWCSTLWILVYELLIYPCLNYRLPTSMKRIGIASFAITLQSMELLVENVIVHFNIMERSLWFTGINSVLSAVILPMIGVPLLEFVCAQSLYNMRGLLTGYMQLVFWLALALGNAFKYEFTKYCRTSICQLSITSVCAAVSIFAFLLYLATARWYKKRVREDIDHPHRWVEEVYDRYLSAVDN